MIPSLALMPKPTNLLPVEAIVFKHVHKRPYCPGPEYEGDRPCLWWAPFLMHLEARGHLNPKRYRLSFFMRKSKSK